MTTGLIDLDRIPADDGPPPRRRFIRPVRPMLGALCLVLVALLGGAAILPSQQAPVIIPARLSDTAFVQGDELYVTGPAPAGVGERLDVYRLPGGKRLAGFTVPLRTPIDETIKIGDVYLVTHQDNGDGSIGILALDATTGRVLWRSPYSLFALSARAGLALVSTSFYQPGGKTLAIDLHTGAQRWSIPAGGFLTVDINEDGTPRWLVAADKVGRVTVYDGSTGAVVATSTLPDIKTLNTAGVSERTHELVIITSDGRAGGYFLPGLERRWQAAVQVPPSWGVIDCGAVLCVGHQGQQGTTGIDPATGRLAWASDRWTYVDRVAGNLVVTASQDDLDTAPLTVLDPATGRVRGGLGSWHYITNVDGKGIRYVEHRGDTRNELIFGEVDWRRMTVRVAGVGEQISDACQVSGDVVVCRLVDSSVGIYRLG